MRTVGAGRVVLALLLGLVILGTAGCFGGGNGFGGDVEAAGRSGAGPSDEEPAGGREVGPRVGNLAPDFVLRDLDGEPVRLTGLRGKPVVLNFWATWCPPCREEMPILEKAYQKHRDQGFVFLGIDIREDVDTVRDFVRKNGYSWTFLLDSSGEVTNSFLVSGIPTSFFIDRRGVVRDRQIGAIGAGGLETKLGKIR